MRQAIVVKYHGPTNSSGARLSASSQAGRTYSHWDYALDQDDNFCRAALAYAKKMGWISGSEKLVGGALPDEAVAFVVVRK
jgi:hypothetical protein